MNDRNAWVATEIMLIERQQVRDAVNKHRGNDPRVMDLDPHDRMNHHKAAPFRMDLRIIREQGKRGLDQGCTAIGFCDA
jgi:hypothetical protein